MDDMCQPAQPTVDNQPEDAPHICPFLCSYIFEPFFKQCIVPSTMIHKRFILGSNASSLIILHYHLIPVVHSGALQKSQRPSFTIHL